METSQIPRLDLPSGGGWVEFRDMDDLTGADLQALRRTIRTEDSSGETSNLLLAKAIELMVLTWEVGYLADPRTPEANPAGIRKLKARDLRALEAAVDPVLELVRPPKPASVDDTSPGSPTPPASE